MVDKPDKRRWFQASWEWKIKPKLLRDFLGFFSYTISAVWSTFLSSRFLQLTWFFLPVCSLWHLPFSFPWKICCMTLIFSFRLLVIGLTVDCRSRRFTRCQGFRFSRKCTGRQSSRCRELCKRMLPLPRNQTKVGWKETKPGRGSFILFCWSFDVKYPLIDEMPCQKVEAKSAVCV